MRAMSRTTKKARQRQMTRREFVGGALAAAGVITGAPAFLRGQNLNNKLNIAFIACGGRANANMSELTIGRARGADAAAAGAAAAVPRRARWRRIPTRTSSSSAT